MPSILKKHKTDFSSQKSISPKSFLKSTLNCSAKASETDERKKMLAKALSEKIGIYIYALDHCLRLCQYCQPFFNVLSGGKRKFDQDLAGTSGAKVRKTQESLTENMSKIKTKEKDWKRTSLVKDAGTKVISL